MSIIFNLTNRAKDIRAVRRIIVDISPLSKRPDLHKLLPSEVSEIPSIRRTFERDLGCALSADEMKNVKPFPLPIPTDTTLGDYCERMESLRPGHVYTATMSVSHSSRRVQS